MRYRKLVCPERAVITLQEASTPDVLTAHEILVRNTHGAEKHGTMQSFVFKHGNARGAWDTARKMHTPGEGVVWQWPIPLGNMQVGYVERVGSAVTRYRVGDRLVAFGGFAPYAVYGEEQGWPIGEDTSWQAATCLDPATFAICALRDAKARIGDAVAIFGLGAIGLAAVTLAKLAGCSPVIVIDPLQNRRAAATTLGADATLDPVETDCGEQLREMTDWRGVDVVIEYSGSVHALNAALRGVAFGGTVACGAFPSPYPAGLDLGAEAHMNRPNIVFTRTESDPNRDHPNWDNPRIRETVMRLIRDGAINGSAIVTPVEPFGDDFAERYRTIIADSEHAIKLGVEYSHA